VDVCWFVCLFACLCVWLCTASASLLAGRQACMQACTIYRYLHNRACPTRNVDIRGRDVLSCNVDVPRPLGLVGGPLSYYRQRVQFNVEHITIRQEYDGCKAMQINAMQCKAVRCDTMQCTQLRTNRNIRYRMCCWRQSGGGGGGGSIQARHDLTRHRA
jgi:hypothetical protein